MTSPPRRKYQILLEFTRDLTATELAPIKPTGIGREGPIAPQEVAFFILDEDNVAVGRCAWSPVSAEQVTGVKGDAFRVVC